MILWPKWYNLLVLQKRQLRTQYYNIWLILPNTQDSEIPSRKRKMNISGRLIVTFAIASAIVISIPKTTYGGFFSIFAKINNDTKKSSSKETLDSMQLLEVSMNADPNPALGGAEVVLEDGSALVANTAADGENPAVARAKTDHISVYEVREGDALSRVAEMFGVSVNTIKWANDLEGGVITPGQTLVILPITGIEYTVKKGDTIATIAKKYGADAEEIADFNGISDTTLAVGAEIIIPDAEPSISKKKSSGGGSSSSSGVSTSGYFVWPVGGGKKTQGIHGYNAVDIGAPVGTPIYAAASGTVMVARSGSWNGGYGNYVVIKHSNGTQTLYAHASSLSVSSGSTVSQGQVIGYVGSTGKSTGPHLHFEVRGGTNPF